MKRMLLQQKAYSEGGFALCMHASSLHERKVRLPQRVATSSLGPGLAFHPQLPMSQHTL